MSKAHYRYAQSALVRVYNTCTVTLSGFDVTAVAVAGSEYD